MSLDGFLTFFGLLIAGYAVLDPISRLKLRLNAPLQLLLVCVAMFIIIPVQFILPLMNVLPEQQALWIAELGFGQPSDLLTNSHIAFFVTLSWAVCAWLAFRFSRPRAGKLGRLLVLVERLHDEGRILELLELVQPYLGSLKECMEQKQSAWSPKRATQASKKSATQIVDILAKSKGVRETLQTVKPKFAADFFTAFYDSHYDWCDLYLAESMSNKDSHLRQDIKRTDSINPTAYVISQESVLLSALVGQAEHAARRGIWKPIGDAVTKTIKEDANYLNQLSEGVPQDQADLYDDITYEGIRFFDILVRQAATQEVADNMWLSYLLFFVQDLASLPVMVSAPSNPIAEYANLREKLAFEALTTLKDWVALDESLPSENHHAVPTNQTDAKDADAIPFWAAKVLSRTLKLILLHADFSEPLKVSCVTSFINTGARQVAEGSYLRTVLVEELIHDFGGKEDDEIISALQAMDAYLDKTHLADFEELGSRIRLLAC